MRTRQYCAAAGLALAALQPTATPQEAAAQKEERVFTPAATPHHEPLSTHSFDAPGSAFDGQARVMPAEQGSAQVPEGPYDYSKGGQLTERDVPARFLGDPYFLGFASRLHHPPQGERLDPLLVQRIVEGPRPGELENYTFAYIMFEGRIDQAKMDSVRAFGVELLHYHPNNCWSAKIPVRAAIALSDLPAVHWIGFAQPDQKIHPVLWWKMTRGDIQGEIPIYIDLFESDLGERSRKIFLSPPEVTNPAGGVSPGDPADGTWRWETSGRMEAVLQSLGVRIGEYREEIHAYEAHADAREILALIKMDTVAFVEWRPPLTVSNDRVVPQMGQDYWRETYKATTETIGVTDSGFHLANGGYNGHLDLNKQAVGWNYWSGGGCGSAFCDEPSEGYHGTHVLGTVCGTGTVINALRGTSPYLGSGGGDHRLFLVKGLTYSSYQHMRNPYSDPWGSTTPRPVLVTNSWGAAGCINSCTAPANYIGTEAGARLTDDEVFQHHQLYIFSAGNAGGAGGGTFVPGTIDIPAVAKNVLAIGMSRDGDRTVAPLGGPGSIVSWSSHGPCGDGRWKPNVNAPGCSTESTRGGTQTGYINYCGTSMSAPAAAGVLSVVAERYPEVKDRPAMFRAWAMATALPWQDATASGTWGRLSSSHLNAYGLGKVSALKALSGGGSLPWLRSWATSVIGSGGQYFDFTVNSGASRLIVVMTWDDPQASAGASSAAVEDIDLHLDREPFTAGTNTGEYYSVSSIDTVEHIIINNPPAGNYRLKIHPYRNSGSVRWGAMAVQLYGDTTPSGQLSLTVDDAYIQPGQSVNVDATASANSYIATNVYLEEGAHTGFTRTGTSYTIKDGQVYTNRHDTNGNMLLGDTLTGSPRTMTYTYRESSGSDAVRTIAFQARSDNWGTHNASINVTVDGTAPGLPTSLRSTNHSPGIWSNNAIIDYAWTAAADNLSGVDGYGIFTTTGSHASPSNTRDIGAVTSYSEPLTTSSSGWYFSIKTVDRCGNWSGGYAWIGPYLIDTIEPGQASRLHSTSHTPGTWSNNPNVAFAWTAATDAHSGLAGYGTLVSDNSARRPGATIDLGPAATSTTVPMQSGTIPWFFNLRSADVAGNWDTQWASSGPYLIDTARPRGPSNLRSTSHTVGRWSPNVSVATAWTAASDAESGLAGYRLDWDHSAGTNPSGALNLAAGATATTSTLRTSASPWYAHLRAQDVAGNWGATAHLGPIYIDNAPPSGPTNLRSTTHNPGTWTSSGAITMAWSAASDPEAGLAGYATVWDHAAGTNPTGALGTSAAATSKSDTLASSASGWYFHIRARDNAGNWGGSAHAGPYLIDTQGPSGASLRIDGGNATTTSPGVTLSIAASDPISGLEGMRLRNDGGAWSPWEPFATSKPWDLRAHGGSNGTGTRRVTLQVRDRAGNAATAADTIYLYTPVAYFGNACPGSMGLPAFNVTGIPGLGRTVSFAITNTAAPAAALYLGISGTTWSGIALPLDLGIIGSPGCFLNISLDMLAYSGPPQPIPVTIPSDPAIVALPLYFQWLLLGDPSGRFLITTRGAEVVISGL